MFWNTNEVWCLSYRIPTGWHEMFRELDWEYFLTSSRLYPEKQQGKPEGNLLIWNPIFMSISTSLMRCKTDKAFAWCCSMKGLVINYLETEENFESNAWPDSESYVTWLAVALWPENWYPDNLQQGKDSPFVSLRYCNYSYELPEKLRVHQGWNHWIF